MRHKPYSILLVGLVLVLASSVVACGQPAPPVIVEFSATPTQISAGESATLRWNVTKATTVSINQGIGNVPAVGTKEVSPATTTAYILAAMNDVNIVTKSVVVTVTAP